MTASIDLLLLGIEGSEVKWPLGLCLTALPEPGSVHEALTRLAQRKDGGVFVWDMQLGKPDPDKVVRLLDSPGDVWHAGLKLGMAGLPLSIDFVEPIWMYNRDPEGNIECTSWRISLRACLLSRDVIHHMGHVNPAFDTLDAAGLEMGHRFIKNGAITRHVPWLIPDELGVRPCRLSINDEARFLHCRYAKKWLIWALARNLLSGRIAGAMLALAIWRLLKEKQGGYKEMEPGPYSGPDKRCPSEMKTPRVSVIVPTLDRYPSLATLLQQLEKTSPPPFEIVVADQTPPGRRPDNFYKKFKHLPLRVLYLSHPGQCTSRNAAITASKGNYLLFLDDDVEVTQTIMARHLETLARCPAPVSSGVLLEDGTGNLPHDFTFRRISDVFPGSNSCLDKRWLEKSGLFDSAFDLGPRADHDLGMRLYLSGALLVLNPEISVVHRHCSRGGLRSHNARKVTFASSRKHLFQWHLPAVTEIYLALRYYNRGQLREMLWLRAMGAFRHKGTPAQQFLKVIITCVMGPFLLFRIFKAISAARALYREYPRIPDLD